ncbi:MAG: hypothetical protein E7410_00200 [Ruminococcaceae bacterium]|nr:hypothetical protein [Oscillospiraceae bacterium]
MTREEFIKARENKRKKNVKLFLRLILIAFFLFAGIRFLIQQPLLADYDKKISELEAQIENEEKSKTYYKELKALYETDDYQKQLARERLGLVEENEKVFIDISGQN